MRRRCRGRAERSDDRQRREDDAPRDAEEPPAPDHPLQRPPEQAGGLAQSAELVSLAPIARLEPQLCERCEGQGTRDRRQRAGACPPSWRPDPGGPQASQRGGQPEHDGRAGEFDPARRRPPERPADHVVHHHRTAHAGEPGHDDRGEQAQPKSRPAREPSGARVSAAVYAAASLAKSPRVTTSRLSQECRTPRTAR